jgi:hypothetical protein
MASMLGWTTVNYADITDEQKLIVVIQIKCLVRLRWSGDNCLHVER